MPDFYSYVGPLNPKEQTVFSNSQPAPAMTTGYNYSPQSLSAHTYIHNGRDLSLCVAMLQPHYSKLTQKIIRSCMLCIHMSC